jgi:WD40 repeat protein
MKNDLKAHDRRVADVIFTPDKKRLLTGGDDGEVKIWDLEKVVAGGENKPTSFKAHGSRLVGFAMSPKGETFLTAGPENDLKLWETKSGKELRQWALRQPALAFNFTPDGKRVATANADSTLYLLELP